MSVSSGGVWDSTAVCVTEAGHLTREQRYPCLLSAAAPTPTLQLRVNTSRHNLSKSFIPVELPDHRLVLSSQQPTDFSMDSSIDTGTGIRLTDVNVLR